MTGHLSAEEIAADFGVSRSKKSLYETVREKEQAYATKCANETSRIVASAHHLARGSNAETRRIYFIQEGDAIKIGQAVDVDKRLALLQCGNPRKLQLVCWFAAARAVERALHKHFRKYRIRGEWYRSVRAIWAYVDRVKEFRGRGGATP